MPTKQTGTGEGGEAVLIVPWDTQKDAGFAVELDSAVIKAFGDVKRFKTMAEARRYCRAAVGVTVWFTFPALLLLVLLGGACSEDVTAFGGAAFGGSGTLVRGSAGASGTGGAGTGGVIMPTESGGAAGGGVNGTAGAGGMGGGHSTTLDDCYAKKIWNAQNDQYMRPGSTCNSCHQFTMAGTVFVRPTDPDNCYGVDGTQNTVSVLIVGDGNIALALKVNESGNFWTTSHIAFPATVSVNYGSGAARMQATVPKAGGDCNSCHTANTAPGRILPP